MESGSTSYSLSTDRCTAAGSPEPGTLALPTVPAKSTSPENSMLPVWKQIPPGEWPGVSSVTATLERTLEPGAYGTVTYSDFLMDDNALHQAIEADREDMIVIRPYLAVFSEGDTIRTPLSRDRFQWEQKTNAESEAHVGAGG